MNLILYGKIIASQKEFIEYLKNKTGMNVLTAQTQQEVMNYFVKLSDIKQLVLLNIAIPFDLGLIEYVKVHHPKTKIVAFASPIVKQSFKIIKEADIELLDDSIDELRMLHKQIKK